MPVTSGHIYRHGRFYVDSGTGELKPKYFIVLACRGGDIVARLLTSRAHARPERPRCFHGHPYPAFFLGVLGGPLTANSWVDLGPLDDFDAIDFRRLEDEGIVTAVTRLDRTLFAELLECAARADDTTRLQERAILDELGRLR